MALTITAAGTGGLTANATTLAFDCGASFAVGDMIVVGVSADNMGSSGAKSLTGVTDVKGHTYDERFEQLNDPGAVGAGLTLGVYTTVVTTAMVSTDDITVTMSVTGICTALVWKVTAASGMVVSYLTGAAANTVANANASIVTSSITSGDTVIGFAGQESRNALTADSDTSNGSWSTQLTAVGDTTVSGTSQRIGSQWKTVTGTATQTYNLSASGTPDWVLGWITLREADPVATVVASTMGPAPGEATSKSFTSVAWNAGDVIVIQQGSADTGTHATPSNANLTFTKQAASGEAVGNQAPASVWTAIAGSSQTGQTISVAATGNTRRYYAYLTILRPWAGATATIGTCTANATETAFSTTVDAGSVVLVNAADWAATAAGKTGTTGSGTFTELFDAQATGEYSYWAGQWVGTAAGTFSFGITSYTGWNANQALAEIRFAGGAGPITLAASPAVVDLTEQTLSQTTGGTSVAALPAVVDLTEQALGISAAGGPISLAALPAIVDLSEQVLSTTTGGVSVAASPSVLDLAEQTLGIIAPSGGAGVALVQSNIIRNFNEVALTSVTAGNFLVAVVSGFKTGGPSAPVIDDQTANVWVNLGQYVYGTDQGLTLAYCASSVAGNIFLTQSSDAPYVTFAIAEFSGIDSSSPVDIVKANATGTGTTATATATGTMSQAGNLIISAMGHNGSTNFALTPTGGATTIREEEDGSNYMLLNFAYELAASTATDTPGWTLATSALWGASRVVFKAVTTSSPQTIAASPAIINLTEQALAQTTGAVSVAALPAVVNLTEQALGITGTAPITLAALPAVVDLSEQALSRTVGAVSVAASPSVVDLTEQALSRTVGPVSLVASPAVVNLTEQAAGISLVGGGATSLAASFAVVNLTEQAPVLSTNALYRYRGTFTPHGWVATVRTEAYIRSNTAAVAAAGFTDQIANLGTLDATGVVPSSEYPGLATWITYAKSEDPNQRIYGWVNGTETTHVNGTGLHDEIATYLGVLGATAGLDGVVLDFEPYTADNSNFLALVTAIRAANPTLWVGICAPQNRWSSSFITSVGAQVNAIMPMLYDTTETTVAAYQATVTADMADFFTGLAGPGADLFPILPSYAANAWHDPAVENVTTASAAIDAAGDVSGAAVYWWFQITPADITAWQLWQGVGLVASPAVVNLTEQALGIAGVAPITLAASPAIVDLSEQALTRTLGATSIAALPATVDLAEQALARTTTVSLTSAPAVVNLTEQVLGIRTSVSGTASVSGTGAIAAVGVRRRLGTASLTGAGAVTGTGVHTWRVTASIAGTAQVNLTGFRMRLATATVVGAGNFSAAGRRTRFATASITGLGTIVGTGLHTWRVTAAVAGTGIIAGTGKRTRFATTLPIAAVGTISATGLSSSGSSVLIQGTSNITAVGRHTWKVTATVGASGSIAATGRRIRLATASIAGTGLIGVAGQRVKVTTASVAGVGAITSTGVRRRLGTASISALGAMSTAGKRTRFATASVPGTGTINATGLSFAAAASVASLNALGSITATGIRTRRTTASIAGAGVVGVLGLRTRTSTATITGLGTINADGKGSVKGVAAINASSALTAQGRRTTFVTASVSGLGTISPVGRRSRFATASISSVGSIAAMGEKSALGGSLVFGLSSITATGRRTTRSVASLSASGLVGATSKSLVFNSATITATSTVWAYGLRTSVAGKSKNHVVQPIEVRHDTMGLTTHHISSPIEPIHSQGLRTYHIASPIHTLHSTKGLVQ